MAQPLKLQTHHQPSLFNKDMLLGGLIATMIPVGGLGIAGALALTAAGAAIGGYFGKARQERENREGKTVGEPSFWNKDTAIGGMIGANIGTLLGAAAFVAVAGAGAIATIASGGIATIPVVTIASAAIAAIGSWVASTGIGAYIGGKMGKSRQAAELEEAKKQTIVNHISSTVSPEVGKAVEYSMEHNKNWGKEITERKLLAEAQQGIQGP